MHSTIDALARICNDITMSLDRNLFTMCVFFDMEKAYYRTWKYGILKALHTAGIKSHMAYYIKNFQTIT